MNPKITLDSQPYVSVPSRGDWGFLQNEREDKRIYFEFKVSVPLRGSLKSYVSVRVTMMSLN